MGKNWAKKAHQRSYAEKVALEAMNTPAYKEAQKKQREEYTLDAFYAFVFMGCDYLEKKHRYKKDGLRKFIEYAQERLCDMDEDYFMRRAKYYKALYGLDVLEEMGCEFDEDVEV